MQSFYRSIIIWLNIENQKSIADYLSSLPIFEGNTCCWRSKYVSVRYIRHIIGKCKRNSLQNKEGLTLQKLLHALIQSMDRFNQEKFTLHNDVILWGHRVAIPEKLHSNMLKEVHTGSTYILE